jgi:N-methylhydantoinase A/oxoprolinase/acetone carboxylase beta subunit
MYKAGNDIGGTFTDTILWNEETGELTLGKVLTTPQDPSQGALAGVREVAESLGASPAEVSTLIHGTTLVSNTLIERKGAKTALITTRGFRDILEMRTEKRYELYDIFFQMPEPLVPRPLRREVTERLQEDGSVLVPLDEQEAQKLAQELIQEGVEAVAICFLHSFRNAAHERRMGEIVQRVAPHMHVSLSVEVNPEIREYLRTSTTVANAYVQPLTSRYLSRLEGGLEELGFRGRMYVMLSNGGIGTSETARRFPVRLAESGPAAGAIASAFYGELLGFPRLVSFDMGGTTAKICFIEDGRPSTTRDFEVARVHRFKRGSGLPLKLPVIDMIEIGAGGGSIARVDRLGLLKVGPESAGASPGPACYGLGGAEPTVTDADLLLGYLDPGYFLGGRMPLHRARAEKALQERVAGPLGRALAEAAWGINQVVNENMANAARVYAAEKGKDTKNYTLVAFGGAGPVHAYFVAQKLGMGRILVPLGAGVTSALGFLAAPLAFDLVRTYMTPLDGLDPARVGAMLGEMEEEGRRLLEGSGVRPEEITLRRYCEMRYVGQGHEIAVPLPEGALSQEHLGAIREAFDREYQRLYHRLNPGYRVECLNWRVVASGPRPRLRPRRYAASGRESLSQALKGSRPAHFPEFGDYRECPVYDRYRLFPGARLEGPAIVEERESTAIIGPGGWGEVDEYLNLLITVGG